MNLLAPAFLAGLLALALPWLLHRFHRQQAPVAEFPSRRFLEASEAPVARRQELRHRWLLFLRCLLIALLCLLFAEPWLNKEPGSAERLSIVALDTSLSMQAAQRWERAIDTARELESANSQNELRWLGFDRQLTEWGAGAGDTDTNDTSLATLQPGFERGELLPLVARVRSIVEESGRPVDLHIISDFQTNALPEELRRLQIPGLEQLGLHDVGAVEAGAEARNIGLTAEAFTEDQIHVRVAVRLHASTAALEAQGGAALPIRLVVSHDGRELAQAELMLADNAISTHLFDRIVLPAERVDQLEVQWQPVDDGSAASDALLADNAVTVAIRQAQPLDVVLSAADRMSPASEVYLDSALQIDDRARLVAETEQSKELMKFAFARLDALDSVLVNPANAALLENGGALLLLAAQDDERINSAQSAAARPTDVSGFLQTGSPVGLIDRAHPLELAGIDWRGVRVYHQRALPLDESDSVLVQTQDGLPLLIERRVDSGRLLILNDRLDGVDSNLPLQPAMVALMQRILDWYARETDVGEQFEVGDSLRLPPGSQLFDESQKPLTGLGASLSSRYRFDKPGVYTLITAQGTQLLDVSLNATEFDLNGATTAKLDAWRNTQQLVSAAQLAEAEVTENGAGPDAENVERLGPNDRQRELSSLVERQKWWAVLAFLLALVCLMESALGNRRLSVTRD